MSIYYIYRVTNTITNQFYIGSRTSNVMAKRKPEEDLWIRYFTSSKVVKQQIDQYGKDAFVAEVRYTSDDRDKIYDYEQIAIFYSINNSLCLNRHYHDLGEGSLKWSMAGRRIPPKSIEKRAASRRNKKLSADTRAKISVANKGKIKSADHRAKISVANKGRIAPNKGIEHTAKTKAKISASKKGKPSKNKGRRAGLSAWNKGLHLTAEHKQHLSDANKGKKQSEETIAKKTETFRKNREAKRKP